MDGQATLERHALRQEGFLRFFKDLPDPRSGNVIHKLHDMIVIAVLAVICGAGGWVQVEEFAKSKESWLRTFLDLPGGIPSHDTFSRVFSLLNPQAFEQCLITWMSALAGLAESTGMKLVCIDGKALRGSFEHAWDKSGMAHMVSAFVAANRMVFAQVAVEGRDEEGGRKGNEITAIPKLLALMDLEGAVVTIDAMGCQREIAAQVTAAGGDYVLGLKGNQPTLHDKSKALIDDLILDHDKGVSGTPVGYCERTEQGHGRIETRRVWVTDEVKWLGKDLLKLWPGLGSIVAVESTRQDLGDISGKVSVERRYFISSLTGCDADSAERMAEAVRGHWGIENKVHWQLDVSFREDERRIRKGYGAENFSRLCRLALNLIKQNTSSKVGVYTKRLKAGWDTNFLIGLIFK